MYAIRSYYASIRQPVQQGDIRDPRAVVAEAGGGLQIGYSGIQSRPEWILSDLAWEARLLARSYNFV